MMDIQRLHNFAKDYMNKDGNFIQKGYALSPEPAGIAMYEEPLVGIASASDPYFELCKEPHIIGPHHKAPTEWLPEARTVVSFFFPLAENVRNSNGKDTSWPSQQWLHARIEGHRFLMDFTRDVKDLFLSEGIDCLAPSMEPSFELGPGEFTSNWSERHAACAGGLGTFSLTKGLITEKGMAGRLTSLITTWGAPISTKAYNRYDEWCIYCGACINRCPAEAISRQTGKCHEKCDAFLEQTRIKEAPRYGCGKCQVKVPCETKAPGITR